MMVACCALIELYFIKVCSPCFSIICNLQDAKDNMHAKKNNQKSWSKLFEKEAAEPWSIFQSLYWMKHSDCTSTHYSSCAVCCHHLGIWALAWDHPMYTKLDSKRDSSSLLQHDTIIFHRCLLYFISICPLQDWRRICMQNQKYLSE